MKTDPTNLNSDLAAEVSQPPRARKNPIDALKKLLSPNALRAILNAAVTLLMGAFCPYDGFEYIALAYTAGCWAARNDYPAAFLGSLAGSLLSGNWHGVFALLIMSVLFVIWSIWQGAKNIKLRDRYMILTASLLITVAALDLSDPALIFRGLLGTALAMLCAFVSHKGIHALNAALMRRRTLKAHDQGAAVLFICLIAFALSGVKLFGGAVTFGSVFVCALVPIFLSTHSGIGVLTVFSAGFGACIAYGVQDGILACGSVGTAVALGMVFGVDRKWLGWLCSGAGLLLLGVLLTGAFTVFEAVCGLSIGFLCMKPAEKRLGYLFGAAREESSENTFGKLSIAADVLDSLTEELHGYAGQVSGDMQRSLLDANRRLGAVGNALYSVIENEGNENIKPRFQIQTGCVLEPEDAEDVSGDSVFIEIKAGYGLVVLSDGMGTGESAQEESAGFIALLRRFIGAGFNAAEAVHCANKLMLDGERADEMYATADVLMIDRLSGEALIVKQGAPPSFIVRGTRIITVYGEALPVGIVGEAEPYTHTVQLEPNDWVVMLTDGVQDSLGGHLLATVTEALSRTVEPDAAAALLVSAAREMRLSHPDDMSAVFVNVTEF